MSIANSLHDWLRQNGGVWHAGGTIERMEWKGERGRAKPSTVGRKLRLLENERLIAAQHPKGHVEYRWIPPEWREKYRTLRERGELNSSKMWG